MAQRLSNRRHRDFRAGLHLGQRLHLAAALRPDVAGAGEPRLVALGNRRAAETERDGVAVGPISDLARRDDGARVFFPRHFYGDIEINLLAPRHRRTGNRQRRRDRLCGRRVEQFGVERERTEVEAYAHGDSPCYTFPWRGKVDTRSVAGWGESARGALLIPASPSTPPRVPSGRGPPPAGGA